MKKHNILKVVLITLLVFLLLTWLLPAASYYEGSFLAKGRIQVGLFDIFSYSMTSVSYFGNIALFVLLIGGFYGVLHHVGAYRKLLDVLVTKFKGKETVVISVVMVLLAVITAFCGLQLGLMLFFPFIISLVLLMGYDKIVALLTTVGAVMIGIAGTLFSYATTTVLASTLELEVSSLIWAKVAILVVGLIALIVNTIMYMKKAPVKGKNKESKENDSLIPVEVKKDDKSKVWPLIVIIDVILLIMILAFMSWTTAFNVAIFDDATKAVTGFKLFDFAIFSKLLGVMKSFGNWTVNEMMAVMLVAIVAIALIYKVKFDDFVTNFAKGAKKALLPALIIILIYTCLVLVNIQPSFQTEIYKFIFSLTKGFNIFTATIVAMLASVFNADSNYAFNSVVPYFISLVSDKSLYPIIWVIFQSVYGITMLVAPTSVILMASLAYLGVPYTKWLKSIWKLLLQLFVILFIIFTILILI